MEKLRNDIRRRATNTLALCTRSLLEARSPGISQGRGARGVGEGVRGRDDDKIKPELDPVFRLLGKSRSSRRGKARAGRKICMALIRRT
jgi:hypothetical protein